MNEVLSVTIQEWLMANAEHAKMPGGYFPSTLAGHMADAAMAVLHANNLAQLFKAQMDAEGHELAFVVGSKQKECKV